MSSIRWERRPQLERPVLVAAFEGWNDAGDAASLAVSYLAEAWDAELFAEIDPEDYFDFTETRPQVKIVDGDTRSIEWPTTDFYSARVPGTSRDVVLVRGVEPQLRWRTFTSEVVEVARATGVELAATLGALLADVPHTRPVKVTGTSDDDDLKARLNLSNSSYEGPTGIIGVLSDALRREGLRTASFWAAVPHYVHQVPSPKAALALVERSAALVGARVNPLELRVAAEEYERRVTERVADDEDVVAYVAQLEEADDDERREEATALPVDAGRLADEVERFLRDQG